MEALDGRRGLIITLAFREECGDGWSGERVRLFSHTMALKSYSLSVSIISFDLILPSSFV